MSRNSSQFTTSGSQFSSKFVATYGKLFQGTPPKQIAPQLSQDRFLSDLLDLKVDRTYLHGELDKLSKDSCLGRLKVRPKLICIRIGAWIPMC